MYHAKMVRKCIKIRVFFSVSRSSKWGDDPGCSPSKPPFNAPQLATRCCLPAGIAQMAKQMVKQFMTRRHMSSPGTLNSPAISAPTLLGPCTTQTGQEQCSDSGPAVPPVSQAAAASTQLVCLPEGSSAVTLRSCFSSSAAVQGLVPSPTASSRSFAKDVQSSSLYVNVYISDLTSVPVLELGNCVPIHCAVVMNGQEYAFGRKGVYSPDSPGGQPGMSVFQSCQIIQPALPALAVGPLVKQLRLLYHSTRYDLDTLNANHFCSDLLELLTETPCPSWVKLSPCVPAPFTPIRPCIRARTTVNIMPARSHRQAPKRLWLVQAKTTPNRPTPLPTPHTDTPVVSCTPSSASVLCSSPCCTTQIVLVTAAPASTPACVEQEPCTAVPADCATPVIMPLSAHEQTLVEGAVSISPTLPSLATASPAQQLAPPEEAVAECSPPPTTQSANTGKPRPPAWRHRPLFFKRGVKFLRELICCGGSNGKVKGAGQ